ncbi:MAG: hypothetical protein AAF651_07230 [Cyanobacteria bacterium P01_C01_bin.73]
MSIYDLTHFTLQDMTACGTAIRQLGNGQSSMEVTASRLVDYCYEHLVDPQTGEPACALIRLFKTHSYADLPDELQVLVTQSLGDRAPTPDLKCLTLLATQGIEPQWQHRQTSQGHQVIPLTSESAIAQIPMISQLIGQFGLKVSTVIKPDPDLILDLEQTTFNVFHVPEALGSPFIPAQSKFVQPFKVRSVLGIGGMLPSGNLFALILFSRVTIPERTATLFKTLALNAKMSLLPFEPNQTFSEQPQLAL